jgi:hypothetical protein
VHQPKKQSWCEMSEHIIVVILAFAAAGIAYFELDHYRRNAVKGLRLEERRFEAEQAHREKRLDLEERQFRTEEEERQKLVRFREEEYKRFVKPASEIAEHLTHSLSADVSWAAAALQKAKLLPYTNTLFGERSEHFHAEKQQLARQFTPYLLRRCQKMTENGGHVFLLIDAGTTLFEFFETIGTETMRRAQRGEEWLNRVHLATNNLPGIGELIKSGKRVPWDRYSELAIKDCHLLPGVPMPVFAAVAGDQTEYAISMLRQLFTKQHPNEKVTFVALVVGNWVRIRRSNPPCPIPLARGIPHQRVKQMLVNNADEIYVVSPLGKLFVGISKDEVNTALGFDLPSNEPDRQPYQDIDIGDELARKVKLVSTTRAAGRLLHEHSTAVGVSLQAVLKTTGGDADQFAHTRIEEMRHLFFPFADLPQARYEEFLVEFPHEDTRSNQKVLEKFQVDLFGLA